MPVTLTLIDSFEEACEFMRWLGERRPGPLAIDTETSGLRWWKDSIRLVQVGDTQRAWAMRWDRWSGLIDQLMRQYDGRYVMHNFKFDCHMIRQAGITVPLHRVDDSRTMAHILNSARQTGLKPLSDALLGRGMSGSRHELEDYMKGHKWDWKDIPFDLNQYWQYACIDTVLTAGIYEILDQQLIGKQRQLYDIEMAAQTAVMDMEIKGCRIDLDYCEAESYNMIRNYADIVKTLMQEYGIDSPYATRRVTTVLQEQGWQPHTFTPTGMPKFTKAIAEAVAEDFPLARKVVEAKNLKHFAKDYLQKILELADGEILHASINPLQARTGRMSISDPPLQQMPRGPEIRDAFIPSEGNKLVLIDYDQMEVFITANLTRDRNLIDAIKSGQDVHKFTASKCYNVPLDQVTSRQRSVAKNAVYAIIYGAGIDKFSDTVGIDVASGAEFMRQFGEIYPGIQRWKDEITRELQGNCDDDGWTSIQTEMGRIQRAPFKDAFKLVNYLVQGTGADVLKLKIAELASAGFGKYMILPIHDEIMFDVPSDIADDVLYEASKIMTHDEGEIPLTVGGTIVDRWGSKYR